jgi:hypothetical protein
MTVAAAVLEYSPEASQQRLALEKGASDTLDLILNNLTTKGLQDYEKRAFQEEGQPDGEFSKTFRHEIEVGALLLLAVGCEMTAIGGGVHDTGKGRDEILKIVTLGRFLEDAERQIVSEHPRMGAEDLDGAISDTELGDVAQRVACDHHNQRPEDFLDAYDKHVWDITSLVSVADRIQAVLLDWSRDYKADRMTREGLLDEAGRLVMDKVVAAVLKDDAGKGYGGVKVHDILDLAIACMPTADSIQQKVQSLRELRALQDEAKVPSLATN